MYLNRVLLFSALCGVSATNVMAQDINSAYYLSNVTTQGTARSMGFGNTLGSIGADYSSTSVNPAGLGVYRSSEFSFTPALRMNSASTEYLGTVTDDDNLRFGINSFGMVFTDAPKGKRYEKHAWKAVSFALGMNRVADLNRNYSYTGVNSSSSIGLAFESDANRYPADAYSQENLSVPGFLGYQAYLIDPRPNSDSFYNVVPFSGGLRQTKTVRERGRVNEYTISLGGNYKEQLMIGGTLGLPSVKYSVTSVYTEELAAGNGVPNPLGFTSLRMNEQLDITGVGVNVKLGAIYKVNDNIRVGGAWHSPTYYALEDTYTPALYGNFADGNTEATITNGNAAGSRFNYGLITPWRGILSASYIFKGKGFITADYEYADYAFMQFDYPLSDGYSVTYDEQEAAMNSVLSNAYKGTSNVRIGGELLVTKYFMARAGFGYYSNPFAGTGIDGHRMDISGGVGFRSGDFFADVALVHSMYQLQHVPYNIDYNYVYTPTAKMPVPVATTDFGMNNLAFTVGVKF